MIVHLLPVKVNLMMVSFILTLVSVAATVLAAPQTERRRIAFSEDDVVTATLAEIDALATAGRKVRDNFYNIIFISNLLSLIPS